MSHKHVEEALEALSAPFVLKDYQWLCDEYGAEYLDDAEFRLCVLSKGLGGGDALVRACEHFLELTFETLRMQECYHKTGVFSTEGGRDRDKCYEDEALMLGKYLVGLYMASIFWKNHYIKTRWYKQKFLPLLSAGAQVLDVGAGPGLYSLMTLMNRKDISVTLNDISPYSERLAASLFKEVPDASVGRWRVELGDFVKRFSTSSRCYGGVVFAEVVEHLLDPEAGMAVLSNLTEKDAVVFFSTATNAAFYDHTIVFNDVDEIRSMIARHRYEIVDELIVPVFTKPGTAEVLDYTAIVR